MPSSVSGRRKGSRTVRSKKSSTVSASNASSPPTPLSAVVEAIPSNVPSKPQTGPRAQKQTDAKTNAGAEVALVHNGGAPAEKPNVFEFLQEGDSSSTSSEDSDSDHEGLQQALTESQQPRRDTRDRYPSYLASPESSFRASSPEQTFSVTSRDSVVTDVGSITSPDGSPATAYLRLVNKQHLQKIAQARSQLDNVHHQEHNPPTDDEEQSDYSAPEEYYLNERMQYHRQQHHQQQQYQQYQQQQYQQPALHTRPKRHNRDHEKRRRHTPPEEGAAGPLVTVEAPKENKNLVKTKGVVEPNLSSGYALLASKLDSSLLSSSSKSEDRKLVPVYRRFENVNHRILLYLQDEISHLEEELQKMDEYETKHRTAIAEKEETERLEPASHRMDVEARRYSAFHARRLELVETLAYKVNQYNDALTSYARMRQILPKASPKDIQTYRTWMTENNPIAKAETRFLDHDLDLVSLNNTRNNSAVVAGDNTSILYFIIGVMSAALLLPLLAY